MPQGKYKVAYIWPKRHTHISPASGGHVCYQF